MEDVLKILSFISSDEAANIDEDTQRTVEEAGAGSDVTGRGCVTEDPVRAMSEEEEVNSSSQEFNGIS